MCFDTRVLLPIDRFTRYDIPAAVQRSSAFAAVCSVCSHVCSHVGPRNDPSEVLTPTALGESPASSTTGCGVAPTGGHLNGGAYPGCASALPFQRTGPVDPQACLGRFPQLTVIDDCDQ